MKNSNNSERPTLTAPLRQTVGGLGGFIVMGILSGLVLMVLGWVRALKK